MQHGLIDYNDAVTLLTALTGLTLDAHLPGAVERTGHHRQGARRRRHGRHHPDGQHGGPGRGRHRGLPVRAGRLPQLRPDPGRSALRPRLRGPSQRRGGVHPHDRDRRSVGRTSTTSSTCPGSMRCTSGRPTSRSALASRRGATTQTRSSRTQLKRIVDACDARGIPAGIHTVPKLAPVRLSPGLPHGHRHLRSAGHGIGGRHRSGPAPATPRPRAAAKPCTDRHALTVMY